MGVGGNDTFTYSSLGVKLLQLEHNMKNGEGVSIEQ